MCVREEDFTLGEMGQMMCRLKEEVEEWGLAKIRSRSQALREEQ